MLSFLKPLSRAAKLGRSWMTYSLMVVLTVCWSVSAWADRRIVPALHDGSEAILLGDQIKTVFRGMQGR